MAATKVELVKAELNAGTDLPEAAALDATDGAYLPLNGQDTKTVILLTGTGTAVFKAGDGLQGVADISVVVSENGTIVEVESGAFKITRGEHKGMVHVTGPETVKAQVCLLI